jgi:hypothetical protein
MKTADAIKALGADSYRSSPPVPDAVVPRQLQAILINSNLFGRSETVEYGGVGRIDGWFRQVFNCATRCPDPFSAAGMHRLQYVPDLWPPRRKSVRQDRPARREGKCLTSKG